MFFGTRANEIGLELQTCGYYLEATGIEHLGNPGRKAKYQQIIEIQANRSSKPTHIIPLEAENISDVFTPPPPCMERGRVQGKAVFKAKKFKNHSERSL